MLTGDKRAFPTVRLPTLLWTCLHSAHSRLPCIHFVRSCTIHEARKFHATAGSATVTAVNSLAVCLEIKSTAHEALRIRFTINITVVATRHTTQRPTLLAGGPMPSPRGHGTTGRLRLAGSFRFVEWPRRHEKNEQDGRARNCLKCLISFDEGGVGGLAGRHLRLSETAQQDCFRYRLAHER